MNKEEEIRLGIRPIITTGNEDREKIRVWVNSEKFPWFPYDGFRVLNNQTVFLWKKKWWIFGKWTVLYSKSLFDEACVFDEGYVR